MKDNKQYHYNRRGGIIEIRIRDADGRMVDKLKAPCNDKKQCEKMFNYIKEKYGFDSSPTVEHNWFDLENDFFK